MEMYLAKVAVNFLELNLKQGRVLYFHAHYIVK